MSTLGQRIVRLRERHVIGQAELARVAGLSPGALWEIENDKRKPRPATVRKIAGALSTLSGKVIEPAEVMGTTEADTRDVK